MQCIETMCVENREVKNLAYHEARLNKTRRELWNAAPWDLSEMITVPEAVDNSIHKCRFVYGEDEIENIRWEPHVPRVIRSLKRVYDDHVDYTYKYENRDELNTLFAQRGEADEILIIKNGWVTDTFYCNVAFFDGTGWFTPKTHLLPGTQRAFLLDTGIIREREISETDIFSFQSIKLFNALATWERAPVIDVTLID